MENNYLCKRYHVIWAIFCLFLVLILVHFQVLGPFLGVVTMAVFIWMIDADVKMVKSIEAMEARRETKAERISPSVTKVDKWV